MSNKYYNQLHPKEDSSSGCFISIILLTLMPYYLAWLSITAKLIESGVVWHRAVVYGYVWPMWVISLIIDAMIKFENGG